MGGIILSYDRDDILYATGSICNSMKAKLFQDKEGTLQAYV
jgi:hypothetical protein